MKGDQMEALVANPTPHKLQISNWTRFKTQGSVVLAVSSNSHPLIRKLESIFTLTDEERDALVILPMQVADLKADQDVVREGDRPSRSFVLLEGFACTYKVTGEGKRQIMAF